MFGLKMLIFNRKNVRIQYPPIKLLKSNMTRLDEENISGKPLVLSAPSSPTSSQFIQLARLLYTKIEMLNSPG
jgi:hypothetical protein